MRTPTPKEEAGLVEDLFFRILHEAYQTTDIDGTIHSILALAGEFSRVSRVYVFEDISPETTRNTYEWCAPGVEPAIGMLQNLRKDEYNYAAIISASPYICDDTRTLPASDQRILCDMQGIQSLVIFTLYHQSQALGYIGFDDTVNRRKWTGHNIQVLEGIATVVSALINRRNTKKELADSRQAMQTIIDSLDDLIFITDLHTYELKFISKSLARSLGMEIQDLLGKVCWEVLHQGKTGPCAFCPIPDILKSGKIAAGETKVWEFQNDITGKWYLVKDSIITWIDGALVHLETAVDITYQKQYEAQLKYSASTDAMTAVYNREWGYNRLKEIAAGLDDRSPGPHSLVFFDLDKLKPVNDEYGHAVGDEMIVNTIKTIFACIRKDDFICRWGGDEFILVLYCDLATASKVMEKIEFAVDHFNQTSGKQYTIAFSYGVVEMSGGGDVDALIQEADSLMYKQKMNKKMDKRCSMTTRRRVPPGGG